MRDEGAGVYSFLIEFHVYRFFSPLPIPIPFYLIMGSKQGCSLSYGTISLLLISDYPMDDG